MLVLSRKLNETVQIRCQVSGVRCRVQIVAVGKRRVKLGIEAAGDVEILRGELVEQPEELADMAEV